MLLPSLASAQGLIDYALLFERHAGKVVERVDAMGVITRFLDLGNGQSVTCYEDGSCVDADLNGATACTWRILSEVRGIVEACGLPETANTRKLIDLHRVASARIAENALPPRRASEIEAAYLSMVYEGYGQPGSEELRASCKALTEPDGFVALVIAGMGDPATEEEFVSAFAEPRLPMMNPCL